jgi:hypothetical protein
VLGGVGYQPLAPVSDDVNALKAVVVPRVEADKSTACTGSPLLELERPTEKDEEHREQISGG